MISGSRLHGSVRYLSRRLEVACGVVYNSKQTKFDKTNWLRLQLNKFKKETQENVHRVCTCDVVHLWWKCYSSWIGIVHVHSCNAGAAV